MDRFDLKMRAGAALHRLRYQRLRGVSWNIAQAAIAPIGQLGLESLCQKDLTKPLSDVEAKIPITIGPAPRADIDQITALAEGLWDGVDEIGPYTRLGVRATVVDRFDRGQKCFVAKIGDQIVHYNWIGFGCEETIAGTGRFLVLDDGEAVCHDGMTVEQYRGKGVHLAVHNQMLIWLKEHGYRRAYTVVGTLDRPANITHHRLDWEVSGRMLYLITKRSRRVFVVRVGGTLDPFDERLGPGGRAP